jgi:hypothetical protein
MLTKLNSCIFLCHTGHHHWQNYLFLVNLQPFLRSKDNRLQFSSGNWPITRLQSPYSFIVLYTCTLNCTFAQVIVHSSTFIVSGGSHNHNIQSNQMDYIDSKHFILQYLVGQSYTFQSLVESSGGVCVEAILHKTGLAIHTHIKKIQKSQSVKM